MYKFFVVKTDLPTYLPTNIETSFKLANTQFLPASSETLPGRSVIKLSNDTCI